MCLDHGCSYAIIVLLAPRHICTMDKAKILREHEKAHKIWRGGDGRWYTRLPMPSERRTVQKHRMTREDLESVIVEHYRRMDDRVTLGQIWTEHQERLLSAGDISPATRDRNNRDFRRFFQASDPLSSWTEKRLEEHIIKTRTRLRLGVSGYRCLTHTARVIFAEARRQGLISWRVDDILERCRPGKNAFRRSARTEPPAFSEEEAAQVIGYLQEHQDVKNLGLLLLFSSGLRVGEVTTLTWDDVTEESLTVRRTETTWTDETGTHTGISERPKTQDGERVVPLPSAARWIVTRLQELTADPDVNPHAWVLFERSHRITCGYLRKRLYSVCDAVTISRRGLHAIRRTYASSLLDAGLPDKAITETLGHSTITITQDRYGRQLRTLDDRRSLLDTVPAFSMISDPSSQAANQKKKAKSPNQTRQKQKK